MSICRLFTKNSTVLTQLVRLNRTSRCFTSNSKQLSDETTPIKYTTSPALQWKAKTSRQGVLEERLWYEPYVVSISLAIFLLYFTVIREENDIDDKLDGSLYQRIDGLEEHQLQLALKYNLEHGLETKEIIKRLKEIEK